MREVPPCCVKPETLNPKSQTLNPQCKTWGKGLPPTATRALITDARISGDSPSFAANFWKVLKATEASLAFLLSQATRNGLSRS